MDCVGSVICSHHDLFLSSPMRFLERERGVAVHTKTVSAFEDRVDKACDQFPFEGRHCAKKYLYLLDLGITDVREASAGLRFKKGNSNGFIDWFGNVRWEL